LYNLPTEPLTVTLVVKMAAIGSRSKSNQTCRVRLVIQGRVFERDFIVMSINENIILGIPFLDDYSAVMGFNPPRLSLFLEDAAQMAVQPAELQQVGVEKSSFCPEERQRLRDKWLKEFEPLTSGTPEGLPPWREINHRIELVDPDLVIRHRRAKCPEAFQDLFREKIDRYVRNGWWVETPVESAAPMMVLPKPKADGLAIRTVVDKRAVNDNTRKDVTPFPDQNLIRRAFARGKFRSKLDMTDAYEQVRIEDSSIPNTAFSTPWGTYVSLVVQQGDCNAPATFQRLVTFLFRKYIGIWVYVYLDDIFIHSDTAEEHEEHLRITRNILLDAKLYLSKKKIFLFTESVDCLGFIVDDDGIHPDPEKLRAVEDWPRPQNVNDVLRFMGLVNYLMNQVDRLAIVAAPITTLTRLDKRWEWGPLEEEAFSTVKNAVKNFFVLSPIDWAQSEDIEHRVFVICDACPSGVAGILGQGPSWDRVKIADMWSARLTQAQSNYPTHQQELLAIVGALDKFEDQLLGRRFTVVTDHRSLIYVSTQETLSPRQVRWWEFLSRFNFHITYVKGSLNVVADALSRKFEGVPDVHNVPGEYLSVDKKLDPDGDELPGGAIRTPWLNHDVVLAVPEEQVTTLRTRRKELPESR
jgi:hypothetical protein